MLWTTRKVRKHSNSSSTQVEQMSPVTHSCLHCKASKYREEIIYTARTWPSDPSSSLIVFHAICHCPRFCHQCQLLSKCFCCLRWCMLWFYVFNIQPCRLKNHVFFTFFCLSVHNSNISNTNIDINTNTDTDAMTKQKNGDTDKAGDMPKIK